MCLDSFKIRGNLLIRFNACNLVLCEVDDIKYCTVVNLQCRSYIAVRFKLELLNHPDGPSVMAKLKKNFFLFRIQN